MDATIWLSAEQLQAFRAAPTEDPVVFVNLIAFRQFALYQPGTEDPLLSGRDAYDRYRRIAREMAKSVGGRALWYGQVAQTLVGPSDETWDDAALAEYPTRQVFLDMIVKPEYRAALVHRDAAIERCRVIVAATVLRNLEP